ncbi:MAG: aspartate aminotransferase family protein [Aestuariibacter sp.]
MAGSGFSHIPKKVPLIDTQYRQIKTQLPVPESIPLLEKMYRIESRSMHGQLPIIWDKAADFQVTDPWGNTWIDFTSTIFVANAGHANPRILALLQKQIDKPLLHTYTYTSPIRMEYLDYLIANTPQQFEKAFLLSAGTEATEVAFKLMRMNGQKLGKRRQGVICFEGAYHGRTLAAQMMTGNPQAREWIGYQDPDIHHLPFPLPWDKEVIAKPKEWFLDKIETLLSEQGLEPDKDICGFMLETFQGWGALFYPAAMVQALEAFAREHDIVIAFDEMQAGFGRTGTLFGYQHYGIEPDLLCCGKGASSGMPLAIVLGTTELMDLPDVGSMSSTHSANPLCCAAGLGNLQALLEDGLIENSATLGAHFHQRLSEIQQKYSDHLSSVQGIGLLAALIFTDTDGKPLSKACDAISELAFQRGLLVVHTGRESIKLAPPLSISKAALNEGLDVLESCVSDVLKVANQDG